MIYQSGGLVLHPVCTCFHGPDNDALICQDDTAPAGTRYLLLLVQSRALVRKLLMLYTQAGQEQAAVPALPHTFTVNEQTVFVFPYQEERRFSVFVPLLAPEAREAACIQLVLECLSSSLPYPLLYLSLIQDRIQIRPDGSVYLSPPLDLSSLDPSHGERACACACAWLILELLGTNGGQRNSGTLLRQKLSRRAYSGLTELYRDLTATVGIGPSPLLRLSRRLAAAWTQHRRQMFRLLLILCTLCAALVVVILFSQLLFGDIPLLRLFERSFEVIGTETLR